MNLLRASFVEIVVFALILGTCWLVIWWRGELEEWEHKLSHQNPYRPLLIVPMLLLGVVAYFLVAAFRAIFGA